jgi:MoaA/NifB/PqqE/SkfB family radical SAM enzyme
MSVSRCQYPWHWMIVTHDGFVMPCGHGSRPVGNLTENSIEEIWNGPVMQAVRSSILHDAVHEVCQSNDCPYQQDHLIFPPQPEPMVIDDELARSFDERHYLELNPDVNVAVARRQFASGLEHFCRHGHGEGRAFRLVSRTSGAPPAPQNAALALVEYSRRATRLRSTPVDLVVQVSTVCNLKCVMCSHGNGAVENPRHMPLEVFNRIVTFVDRADRMIVSGLGEPMLAPVFWALIARCASREGVFIRANSNALLLTDERVARLLDSGLKEISFSLDAATSETYGRIRGGDFARALAGIRKLCLARKARPNSSLEIFINMTLMKENLAEAAAFVDLGADLEVDAVLFSQLFPFGANGDRPWRAERGGWKFDYADQMISSIPDAAAEHLGAAKARAAMLGMTAMFLSNTECYLTAASAPEVLAVSVEA